MVKIPKSEGCVGTVLKHSGIIIGVIGFIIAGVILISCGDTAGEEDAPVGKRHEAERQVWVSSDEYPNVEAYCIGENSVYLNSSDSANKLVKDDPNCDEGGILVDN